VYPSLNVVTPNNLLSIKAGRFFLVKKKEVSCAFLKHKPGYLTTIPKLISAIIVRSDGEKTTKNNEIKPQKTREFNVENPSNAKGKNYGRQPARPSLYRVCVYNA